MKLRVESQSAAVTQSAPAAMVVANTYNTQPDKVTDYIGNKVYENGSLKMVLHDEGYYDAREGKYYFYFKDHLGSNRVVTDGQGYAIQQNHYYAFGMSFGDDIGPDKQPYGYNGKEQDRMHGLNSYDYSARHYEPDKGRFATVDPHAEKYFSWSPYAYCANNPIRITDPTGMDWFVDNNTGNVVFIRGVSDLSTLDDEQLENYRLGNINQYENLGADNMFGDVVEWGESGNILNYSIFNFVDVDASTSFMKGQGYEKAERLRIRESVEHGYDIEDAWRTPSRETLSRQITYVTPDKYGRYDETLEGVRTDYSYYPPAWTSGAQGSYTLIQPYGAPPSAFNQMMKSTPEYMIEIPGEIKNYYREKIDKAVKKNITPTLKYRHLSPLF